MDEPVTSEDAKPEQKEGRRLMARMKAKLKEILTAVAEIAKWADYDDGEEPESDDTATGEEACKPKKKDVATIEGETGFKVYTDKAGKSRWLAWTTNAFKDKDGEIFRTQALEDEVSRTDKEWPEGDRKLLFWHLGPADIGTTDWRGVVGRILVESGVFDSTSRGQKALAYFASHPGDDYRMSHGYRFKKDDRDDGVYEWLQIVERSVLPGSAAANPFTKFTAKESTMLDEAKRKALETVLGADEAALIIKAAEEKTKELEKDIAFKDTPSTPDAAPESGPLVLDETAVKAIADAVTQSAVITEMATAAKAQAEMLTNVEASQKAVSDALAAAQATIAALDLRLKAVEKVDAEKVKAAVAGVSRAVVFRASQDPSTAVDAKDAEGQKLVASSIGRPEDNPDYPLNRPLIKK